MSFKVVGIGEVLWDMLPAGKQLGGAPANFVYHAQALGAQGTIISRVGNDPLGKELLERLQQIGLSTDCIQLDPTAPTGTVGVEVASDGQPQFTIHENVAWDNLAAEDSARRAIVDSHAICFGTLAQRSETSRNAIFTLLKLVPELSLRVFDINLRQNFYTSENIERSLRNADILKINDQELPLLAKMLNITGDTRAQITEISSRFELHTVACTRGAHGSLLFSNGNWSDHPGIPTQVVDTIGAGDAFTAAMVIGLLSQLDLQEINETANQVAAFVASQAGATPALPASLRGRFSP